MKNGKTGKLKGKAYTKKKTKGTIFM